MLKTLKKIAVKLLSIPFIRKTYNGFNRTLLEIFASNRILATFYSLLGFATFNREQYAVLRGRRDYYRSLKKNRRSRVELRRNIHRLEKGMSMQPLRDVFALDYIIETVEFYLKADEQCEANPEGVDIEEMQWAHDVLERYFSLVKKHPVADKAREMFESAGFDYKKQVPKAPFKRGKLGKSSVSYDDLLELSMRRRSVRWFENKPVPRELIDKALMVARQSPTACNRLPYEFKIYDDPELVKKVAAIPFGAAGYSHNIQTIVVVVGKLDSYFSPRDRHVIYIDASLAVTPFMYALETLGLASSPINWPDFEPLEAKMQKAIGLKTDERPIMLIALGYPDKDGYIPFSQKKSLDVLRTYNSLGSLDNKNE